MKEQLETDFTETSVTNTQSKRKNAIGRLYEWLMTTRPGKTVLLAGLLGVITTLWVVELDVHPHADSYCPIQYTTGLPCPGCGATRGTYLIVNGHVEQGIMMNPVALLFLLLTLAVMVLLGIDIARGAQSHRSERYMAGVWRWGKKLLWIIIPLVLLNWLWNIDKFMQV